MSRNMLPLIVTVTLILLSLAGCPTTPRRLAFLDPLVAGSTKWVDYAPTHFDPGAGQFPTIGEIRADLEQLAAEGYEGILTYDVGRTLGQVPRLAKEMGFEVVGVGIWDIADDSSLDTAVKLEPYADFYIVGSEGLFRAGAADAYSVEELKSALDEIALRTGKPVTTAEPWDTFLNHVDLAHDVDFICANAYGWWQGEHEPVDAASSTAELYDLVNDAVTEELEDAGQQPKPVIVRETGFPTSEHPDASVTKQQLYFAALRQKSVPFVHFEAYDQPWKQELDEGFNIGRSWGLHDSVGNLKEGEPSLAFTLVPPLGSQLDLEGVAVNVDRTNFRVVVYIRVSGEYWVKPTLENPFTSIAPDGSWTTDITTGGVDEEATEIRAYLVPRRDAPSLHTLPTNSIASVMVTR